MANPEERGRAADGRGPAANVSSDAQVASSRRFPDMFSCTRAEFFPSSTRLRRKNICVNIYVGVSAQTEKTSNKKSTIANINNMKT
jgi:hypothetical protein